jgi:hypothetical protein
MCWQNECFEFRDLKQKKVLVFISGPGYLEYPWALETALRAKEVGAIVTVVDLSSYAKYYAQRLRIKGLRLPINARSILRAFFLRKKYRIENLVKKKLELNNITYLNLKPPKKNLLKKPKGAIKIDYFNGLYYGRINFQSLLFTVLSGFQRKKIEPNEVIDKEMAVDIQNAVIKTVSLLDSENFIDQYEVVFICNGRMPVQAVLAKYARDLNKSLILYEGGGGYIYPKISDLHIDYFMTSPHNKFEHQEKIKCFVQKAEMFQKNGGYEYLDYIRSSAHPPFNLDWIPEREKINLKSLGLSKGNYFVYFASSEYEFSISMGISPEEQKNLGSNFVDQIHAVNSIIENLHEEDFLVIRLHPRDPGFPGTIEQYWQQFYGKKNIVVISHASNIDSYSLGKASKGALVWDSTIGFELATMGVPVGSLGNASYACQLENSNLLNSEMLKSWLRNPQITPIDKLLPYAIYLRYSGYPLIYSKTSLDRKIFIDGFEADRAKFYTYKILNKIH